MTDSFTLAIIGSSFGLKGFVKVKSLSGETGHLASLKSVILRHGNKEEEFFIEETMPSDNSFILMRFKGINSPEAAKTLTGAEVIADRANATPLKQNEFYIEDLKGLKLITASPDSPSREEVIGHITDIIEGGGGDLAEVRLLSGAIRLVPFRNEFLGDISIEEGKAVLLEKWILE